MYPKSQGSDLPYQNFKTAGDFFFKKYYDTVLVCAANYVYFLWLLPREYIESFWPDQLQVTGEDMKYLAI